MPAPRAAEVAADPIQRILTAPANRPFVVANSASRSTAA